MIQDVNKRVVVVLGMHRSGTSALTRSLQLLGIDLGQNMLPVAADNEKGFWEDADINALNVSALQSLGSDWHHLKGIDEGHVQDLKERGFVLKAAKLLQTKLADVDIFGFKDPRVAILLPFWKEVFSQCGLLVDYLFAIRHPTSVAKSLQKRNGIDIEKSYLLWLNYVVKSIEHGAEHGGIIIDYDNFMRFPDREIERLAAHLRLNIDAAALKEYRARFLDADLRHTVYEAKDLAKDATCPPLVREVYEFLLDIATGQQELDTIALATKATEWSLEIGRLQPMFKWVDRLCACNTALSHANTELSNTNVALSDSNTTLSNANAAISNANAELSNANAALSNANAELSNANAELSNANAALSNVVTERDAAVTALRQSLSSREASLEAVLMSTSWRITSPLRRVASSRFVRSFRR
jgi:hypothetical protein